MRPALHAASAALLLAALLGLATPPDAEAGIIAAAVRLQAPPCGDPSLQPTAPAPPGARWMRYTKSNLAAGSAVTWALVVPARDLNLVGSLFPFRPGTTVGGVTSQPPYPAPTGARWDWQSGSGAQDPEAQSLGLIPVAVWSLYCPPLPPGVR